MQNSRLPLWTLFGLKKAYNVGKWLQLDGYTKFKELFDDILEKFRNLIPNVRRKDTVGNSFVPMNLEFREGYDHPLSATWALAQAIYPGEVFDPNDQFVEEFLSNLDFYDNEEGIPAYSGWIHHEGLWSYCSMFYAEAFLYCGKPEKAVDYLYAFANHASPSRVWREEQALKSSRSSDYCGDMPHNWASAEFIRLVRNLIILEKENTLEILRGVPREWLPTGTQDLCIRNMRTRYGILSLNLRFISKDQYELHFNIEESFDLAVETVRLFWDGTIGTSSGGQLGNGSVQIPFSSQIYTLQS